MSQMSGLIILKLHGFKLSIANINRVKITQFSVFVLILVMHYYFKSSQVELYCHYATCVDIQWDEMSCLTGLRCYIYKVKQYKPLQN